jgi:hypothetical protein
MSKSASQEIIDFMSEKLLITAKQPLRTLRHYAPPDPTTPNRPHLATPRYRSHDSVVTNVVWFPGT